MTCCATFCEENIPNSENHDDDQKCAVQVWMLAVKIAKENAQGNVPEVVDAVAKKMRNAGFLKEAAKLYEDIKAYKEVPTATEATLDGKTQFLPTATFASRRQSFTLWLRIGIRHEK